MKISFVLRHYLIVKVINKNQSLIHRLKFWNPSLKLGQAKLGSLHWGFDSQLPSKSLWTVCCTNGHAQLQLKGWPNLQMSDTWLWAHFVVQLKSDLDKSGMKISANIRYLLMAKNISKLHLTKLSAQTFKSKWS